MILPCLDEATALPLVLAGLPAGYRAIVVDNGSSDESAGVAAALGATVVTETQRGFGAACAAGLAAATAPVVAFCDCDGSLALGQLARVVEPVVTGHADLVLGRRRPVTRQAWPLHARLMNRELARRVRRRTGLRLRDLGPMRAARRVDFVGLAVVDRRSGYPLETVVRAADAGWRVVEVDVDYLDRVGQSKVTGTLRGTLTAVADMTAVLAR